MSTIEYRIELGSRFHWFSNGRWWTDDRREAENAFRHYAPNNPHTILEEWRNGEFYQIARSVGPPPYKRVR